MLNVSTALPTLSPPGAPGPGKSAGGDFQDILGGLSATPVADPLLAMPTVKVVLPGECAVAPAGPATAIIPDTGEIAAPTVITLDVVAPAMAMLGNVVPTMAPISDTILAPIPTAAPEPALPVTLFPVLPIKRQALADGGKPLPDDAADDDPSEDAIWLPAALLQPVPAPATQSKTSPMVAAQAVSVRSVVVPAPLQVAGLPVANASAGKDSVDSADFPATAPTQARAQSGEAIAPSLPSPDWAPAYVGVAAGDVTPAAPTTNRATAVDLPAAAKPDLPVRVETTSTAPTQPVPLQQASLQPAPAILPAGQAFAAAITAAVQQGRDERDARAPQAPLALATATLERLHAPAVAAPTDARQTALDLRQDSGLQGMIDHIEVLRDGANAGDTRIRLVPDALGAVDVSVRRDGDRLHVHFSAENQASARLISDAQPRLAELADARGVKLGQTSVDSGDGQAGRQQPAVPIQFTRPATAADPIDTTDDLRVA